MGKAKPLQSKSRSLLLLLLLLRLQCDPMWLPRLSETYVRNAHINNSFNQARALTSYAAAASTPNAASSRTAVKAFIVWFWIKTFPTESPSKCGLKKLGECLLIYC